MKFRIVKKQASSLKEIEYEPLELENVKAVKDLLIQILIYEYNKQQLLETKQVLSKNNIDQQAGLGKVTFSTRYNTNKDSLSKAINTMLQDFHDGLIRVFINQREYCDLEEEITLLEENEVVLIQLVMMAGRLW
ncbi:hypothetical protein WKT02_01145 [Erysipelotrichaceae bacterium HCN-30851]